MSAYLYLATKSSDFEDYYRIKCDPSAILWSGCATAPNRDKLQNHYKSLIYNNLNGEGYLYYLKETETDSLIGYDLMTVIDKETVESSGHSILQEFQGKGYGNLLFSLLVEEAKKLGFKRFTGWISENNIGSIKNVEHSGFVRTDEFRFGRLEAFDREDKFYKYELIIP